MMRFIFRDRYDFMFCDAEKSLFLMNFDRIKLNAEEDHFESQDQEVHQ
jgi:hypothetical protein